MRSPFEEVVASLTDKVRQLDPPAQVALFASAGEALAPRYRDWVVAAGQHPRDPLIRRSLSFAGRFARGGRPPAGRELLQEVEAATPVGPTDVPWFTAAQNCWICLDTALRTAVEGFDAAHATWYIIEAVLQATSERLFGYSDVGSDRQAHAESVALSDVQLKVAVSGLWKALDLLTAGAMDDERLERLAGVLEVVSP